MSKIELSIIILNYNTKELTLECIHSLLPHLQDDWELIVVDNNSTDGSVEAIQEVSRVRWIKNSKNIGFSAGNNVGIRQARGNHIMLVNSDVLFPKKLDLSPLLDHLSDPSVGMVSPRIEYPNGKLDPSSHRGVPTPWNALMYFTGLSKLSVLGSPVARVVGGYHQQWKSLASVHEIDVCTCACVLVSRNTLDTVGLLDERFFMYAEDIDWCLRTRDAGLRILFDPRVTVVHRKGQSGTRKTGDGSAKKVRSITTQYFFDTMILFYDKHHAKRYPSFVRTLVVAGISILTRLKGN